MNGFPSPRTMLTMAVVLLLAGFSGCVGVFLTAADEDLVTRPMTSVFLLHLSSALVLFWFAHSSKNRTLWILIAANIVDAGNALTATHGDNFDVIGVWFNFPLHHNIWGEAVYFAMENDVTGIGSYFGDDTEFRNRRGFCGFWHHVS